MSFLFAKSGVLNWFAHEGEEEVFVLRMMKKLVWVEESSGTKCSPAWKFPCSLPLGLCRSSVSPADRDHCLPHAEGGRLERQGVPEAPAQ